MAQAVAVKRTSMEIIYEILQLNGKKKTDIMYRTALTYPQTMRYLELLVERGLLLIRQDAKGRDIFEATDRGRQTLQHLKAIIESLAITNIGS